jgi:hypothetical protein
MTDTHPTADPLIHVRWCRRVTGGLVLLVLAFWIFMLGASFVQGASMGIPAIKDNSIFEESGGQNSNGSGEYLFVGLTLLDDIRRGLLAFDIAGSIPTGSTITNVELSLFLTKAPPRTGGIAYDFTLHRALSDWGEGASDSGSTGGQGIEAEAGDATWLHTFSPGSFWTTPGGDFSATASATQSIGTLLGSYNWGSSVDMVADVQHWLDNPSQDFGWVIVGDESTPKSARQFGSRENTVPGQSPPLLSIEYVSVPEPGTLVLSLLATLGTICIARNRSS